MRKKLMAVAAVAAAALLAACASGPQRSAAGPVTYKVDNVTYANLTDFLAAVQRQTDSFVVQVVPTGQRVGGTLLVVLPSTATIRRIWTKVELRGASLDEMLARVGEINLVANAEAVERGHAFDSVRIIRADAPELYTPENNGEFDYVLRYTTKHTWTLSRKDGTTSELGVSSAKVERVESLNGFNISVLNAAADLGARVVRQPVPPGPAKG